MRNAGGSIKRTIVTTKCECTRIGKRSHNAKRNSAIPFTEVVYGAYHDTARATRYLRRLKHDNTIHVLATEVTEQMRKMSIQTFVKYSKPIGD